MNDFRLYKGLDSSPYIMHYGKGHDHGGHSGRYEWGSGERPKQSEEYDRSQDSAEQAKAKIKSVAERIRNYKPKTVRRLEAFNNRLQELLTPEAQERQYRYLKENIKIDINVDNIMLQIQNYIANSSASDGYSLYRQAKKLFK